MLLCPDFVLCQLIEIIGQLFVYIHCHSGAQYVALLLICLVCFNLSYVINFVQFNLTIN